jgi:hypothetical protein
MRPLVIAGTVFLAVLSAEPDLRAQVAPPPIIVPQVTPQFNNPGPQLTIPRPGNPLQQTTPHGTRSRSVTGRSADYVNHPRHHHVARHRRVSRTQTSEKRHNRGTPSREAPVGNTQPTTSSNNKLQATEQTPADNKLKELDEALAKKLKSICRGC